MSHITCCVGVDCERCLVKLRVWHRILPLFTIIFFSFTFVTHKRFHSNQECKLSDYSHFFYILYCSCKPSFRNIICKLNATTQVHCSSLIVVVKSIYTIYVISEDRYALTQLIIIVFFIYIGINWNNK